MRGRGGERARRDQTGDWEPAEVEDVECLAVHGKALQMRILVNPTTSKTFFFATSLVEEYDGEVQRPGDRGTVTLPLWLARREGLV